jgi:hypothetical protein
VDDKEGNEALVLEHMSQHGWKDAVNKKKGTFAQLGFSVSNVTDKKSS